MLPIAVDNGTSPLDLFDEWGVRTMLATLNSSTKISAEVKILTEAVWFGRADKTMYLC